jgi:hypothetical protein
MKFKLGMLIGAGVSYLVTSGKGKELLAQARERAGAGDPDWMEMDKRSGSGTTAGSGTGGMTTGMSTGMSTGGTSTGSMSTAASGFADPGVPDAFGTAVLAEEETVLIESEELGRSGR